MSVQAILNLSSPTNGFMCDFKDNVAGLLPLAYRLVDANENVLFQIQSDPQTHKPPPVSLPREEQDNLRTTMLDLDTSILEAKQVVAFLSFAVSRAIKNLRLIEKVFIHDTLVSVMDVEFGPCTPNTSHTWDIVFELPNLPSELLQSLRDTPYIACAESFYVADDQLVLHTKTFFAFRSSLL